MFSQQNDILFSTCWRARRCCRIISQLFSSDFYSVAPKSKLLTQRFLGKVTNGYLPLEFVKLIDNDEFFDTFIAADDISAHDVNTNKTDRLLLDFELSVGSIKEEDIVFFEFSDYMHVVMALWLQAVCDATRTEEDEFLRTFFSWRTFFDIQSALEQSSIAPMLDAYAQGVPLEDIVLDKRAWQGFFLWDCDYIRERIDNTRIPDITLPSLPDKSS